MTDTGPPRLRIGVSSCLLGEKVRYNGGHKRDAFVVDTLSAWCDWVPVCPEFEMGLGAPRESLRLVGDPASPRLLAPASDTDHTAAMKRFNAARLAELAKLDLHGFILKKDSPTCGLSRVRVWHESGGGNERKGTGLWARDLTAKMPLLPVEEEGRLNDLVLRENFIERVFAYYRWTRMRASRPRPRDLVRFHTGFKLTLLSHSPKHYRELGRLVAEAGSRPLKPLLDTYGERFMEALTLRATRAKHTNVRQHLQGFLKHHIDAGDRAELARRIAEYRQGLVPLVVPLTLLQHHFRRHPEAWVEDQVYLNPYPSELMLRNHV